VALGTWGSRKTLDFGFSMMVGLGARGCRQLGVACLGELAAAACQNECKESKPKVKGNAAQLRIKWRSVRLQQVLPLLAP
jgi:hypothetical protein